MIPEKQKILIVDDSEMNRAILTGILDDGYDFLEAENGLQALDVLRAHRDISLVLLDIVMPELDGFGVLSVMGEQHWIDQTPVIMISAESDSLSAPISSARRITSAARSINRSSAAASSTR